MVINQFLYFLLNNLYCLVTIYVGIFYYDIVYNNP